MDVPTPKKLTTKWWRMGKAQSQKVKRKAELIPNKGPRSR